MGEFAAVLPRRAQAGAVPRIAGLVLAAGGGARFGGPKQLAPLAGRPLLEHALAAIAAATGVERTVVTLGAHAQEILAAVDLHGADPLLVPDWEEGQAASLRAGVAALAAGSGADAVVVLLGDQPLVSAAAIERVLAAWGEGADAVRATFGGRPGHPVLLGRALYPAIAMLRGDAGARDLLARATVREVACGPGAVRDVDTPAQLRAAEDMRL